MFRFSNSSISQFPNCKRQLQRFSRQPVGDLLARPQVVVVDVDQHGREGQSLLTSFVRAAFRNLVETAEQPLEMIRNQLPVLPRQMIEGVVDRAERARSPLLIEITAETLRTACRTRANVLRQFALLALECRYHRFPPAKRHNCSARRVASWTCGPIACNIEDPFA